MLAICNQTEGKLALSNQIPTIIDVKPQNIDVYDRRLFEIVCENDMIRDKIMLLKKNRMNEFIENNIEKKKKNRELIAKLKNIQTLYSSLPPIEDFAPVEEIKRVEIPKIRIEQTDSKEIKKYIKRINEKTQTFACDHKRINMKCKTLKAKFGDIFNSDEYKDLQKIDEIFSSMIYFLIQYPDKVIDEASFDDRELYHEMSDRMIELFKKHNKQLERSCNIDYPLEYAKYKQYLFEIARRYRIEFNEQIIELNANNDESVCLTCQTYVNRYNYAIQEIKEEREALNTKIKNIKHDDDDDVEIEDEPQTLSEFIEENYKNVGGINGELLRPILDSYKQKTGIKILLKDADENLAGSKYRVVSPAGTKYVKLR
jgi:hypothetical protein